MYWIVLKVLELEGILHATTALLESLELLQLQQVCECLWYSGHAGPRRMVRTRLYERGNRGSAILRLLRTGFPQILWLRFSTFSMTLCFFMSWSCFGSKCVADAFADILFAEVKDESFNGDY